MAYEQKTPLVMAIESSSEEMDAAADLAGAELADLSDRTTDQMSLTELANWWKRWYLEAGHKRLGRVLLKYAEK